MQTENPEIYLNNEVITLSPENRQINLLTISSFDNITNIREDYMSDLLFP